MDRELSESVWKGSGDGVRDEMHATGWMFGFFFSYRTWKRSFLESTRSRFDAASTWRNTLRCADLMCSGTPLIGDWVESIFGVRTLQEFQATIRQCRERQGSGTPAIIILGTIPAGISVQLDFLTNLFIFHSDDEPQIELDYIRIFFGIGESQVFSINQMANHAASARNASHHRVLFRAGAVHRRFAVPQRPQLSHQPPNQQVLFLHQPVSKRFRSRMLHRIHQ